MPTSEGGGGVVGLGALGIDWVLYIVMLSFFTIIIHSYFNVSLLKAWHSLCMR